MKDKSNPADKKTRVRQFHFEHKVLNKIAFDNIYRSRNLINELSCEMFVKTC